MMKLWLSGVVFGWLLSAQKPPETAKDTPAQPLPYNHKLHLSLKLKCQDCHTNPDPGERMGFPATAKCMSCHALIGKDKPAIRSLASFAQSGEPIPWVRVYSVAAGVYWSHRSHLEANLTCEGCHGEVAQMEVMSKPKDVTTMAGCMACHRANGASTGCEFCHEGK